MLADHSRVAVLAVDLPVEHLLKSKDPLLLQGVLCISIKDAPAPEQRPDL